MQQTLLAAGSVRRHWETAFRPSSD